MWTEVARLWPWPGPRPDGLALRSCRYGTAPRRDLPVPAGCAARRAAEWQAGRRAAQAAMCDLTGTPVWLASAPDRAPLWPPGVVGAITHHDGDALALVGYGARFAGLGVDCETLIGDAPRLAPLILTEAERARHPDARALTLAFSAKESLYKALAPQLGRFFGFEAAELASDPQGRAVLRLTQDLGPGWPRGRRIPVAAVWRGARVLTAVMLGRDA